MKRYILIMAAILGFALSSYAQTEPRKPILRDSLQKFSRTGLRQIDSVKITSIALIQAEYKAQMKKLMSDSLLKPEEKQKKVDVLLIAKNAKIAGLLDSDELRKILPHFTLTPPVFGGKPSQTTGKP